MNKRLVALVIAVFGVAVWGPASRAMAQEAQITGPLAGAPAVMKMRLYRQHRLHIKPFVGITLEDEFSRSLFVGGQLAFHITDWLGIGAFGAVSPAGFDTGLTDEVASKGQTAASNVLSLPDASGFPDQIARLKAMFGAEAIFIPLRGKLGLFEKLFVDTDFYISGGVAGVQVEERADVSLGNVCSGPRNEQCRVALADQQDERASRMAIAPTFAAGLSLYMADFLALNIEWRALPFAWNTSGTDIAGAGPSGDLPDGQINADDRETRFNHMVSLGLAFYLPTGVTITHSEEAE